MDQHQILTGAVNAGDNCYSVGSVEGVPFTAYSAGCNIVILASNFQRVQIIPGILHGNVQVGCIDCSTDVGKIAAAYGKKVYIFEPTPLLEQNSIHKLDYRWIQTASLETDCFVSVISWSLEGNKLLTGGTCIQVWHLINSSEDEIIHQNNHHHDDVKMNNANHNNNKNDGIHMNAENIETSNDLNGGESELDQARWNCVWQCRTSSPVCFLRFSPDGSLFVSAGKTDRLVKVWYESAAKIDSTTTTTTTNPLHSASAPNLESYHSTSRRSSHPLGEINYSFIYIAHPRAVTGISWRKTSKYLSRGSVANMLVTSCRDNICRLWVQTLLPDDGLVNFSQIETLSNHAVPRNQTQRHRQKLLLRLKHMKAFSQFKKRQAAKNDDDNHLNEPIPTLPSTFSVHDFHSFAVCGTAITPGFHFHLAASINAETDIPLVPSLSPNDANGSSESKNYPNFVIHWLNNKEMVFTRAAEKLLQEISVKIMQTESAASGPSEGGESDTPDVEGDFDLDNLDNDATITAEQSKKLRHKLCRQVQHKHKHKHKHHGKDGGGSGGNTIGTGSKIHHATGDEASSSEHLDSQPSRQSCHTLSSSASTTIDLNNLTNHSSTASISDLLDRRFEALLREWHSLSDLLFSIHPVDGSLLVWLVQWLDEACPGSFRQAQVNFSSRIPNAIPLGDAATMSHNLALYSPLTYLNLKATMAQSSSIISNLDSKACSEDSANNQSNSRWSKIDVENSLTPTVCMATKHSNGSLNLWSISFAEVTKFTQLMSISHVSRVCGHRFRVNDISCHPVLPLLLTTSHHNLPGGNTSIPKSMGSSVASSPSGTPSSSICCPPLQGLPNSGFCSELILWKVDPVGPLSMSGGVTELARINSLETAAFANVAWLPTLLPSTTLGSISNSPSACFIASDGHQLRVYQAVIDARTLLSEISLSQRCSQQSETNSPSSDATGSSDFCGYRSDLHQAFKIVSLQSTSRPGCILELDAISDATHDWQYTQMLHVFQDQLLRGEEMAFKCWNEKQGRENLGLVEPSLGAVVDLRHYSVFREPFFLTVLEKDPDTGRSVLHMWKLIISSHSAADLSSDRYAYVPDSNLVQDDSDIEQSSRSGSPITGGTTGAGGRRHSKNQSFRQGQSYSPLQILTTKVCTQVLPIPEGVEILHATPAAGHLSSSNIYPACFAPYLICTACSDGTLRFWRCAVDDKNEDNVKYEWKEWEMLINSERSSAIEVPGLPLYVSCAYSGRIACAYKHGQSFSRPTSKDPNLRYININLAIYECESTGGSEWVLEDTIHLKNIVVPQTELNQEIDLGPLINTALRNRKTLDTLVHRLGVSHDEHHETNRSTNNIQRLLSVPSYTTMQSLKKIISEQGNQFTLTQKSIVQLDWVSTEDGSHILTVSVGDKISVFTPVSTDIAQANLQAMKTSSKTGAAPATRMLLKQVSSMAIPMTQVDDIRWMKLRTTHLKTADGLPPLPMQMSWVRDGILVVGMDNEMHIYTQWKSQNEGTTKRPEMLSEVTDSRVLTEEGLLIHAQESSHLRLPSHTSLTRSPSSSVISGIPGSHGDNRKHNLPSKGTPTSTGTSTIVTGLTSSTDGIDGGPPSIGKESIKTTDEPKTSYLSQLPDFGIFEASRLACPVLPQYHPKQLMELLAFGKISRVRAILSHLVKSLCSMDSLKNYLSSNQGYNYESTERPRSWTRSRTLSIAAPPTSPGAPSPLDTPDSYFLSIPEEVQLDYTEITSIRPLPLFALIEAEDEKPNRPSTGDKANSPKDTLFDYDPSNYDGLFNSNSKSTIDETLDELLGKSAFNFSGSNKANKRPDTTNLKDFNAHQARLLTKLLTHSHLPGLSSLDQMHLLALADAVASFNPSKDPSASSSDSDYYGNLGSEVRESAPISADSLDDCGLRFLLAMRQHTYLLRCLPIVHRKLLQKQGLSTSDIVWAFHSETQEELIQLIPSVAKGNPKWNELRELGCGWWIRNNAVLRRLMEQVAKASFQAAQDPLDAALFYLAMKKKSLVWGLYRSIGDRKMTEFFQNNFNEDKWRRSALKNAYALLGKQRFTHAAAFFLLGGAIWDAIEVCLNKLEDMQLAMTVVRLYEGDIETIPSNLKRILYQEILGCDLEGKNFDNAKAHPDPFLRSMSYWMLQDYSTSLVTLLVPEAGEKHPKFSSSTDEEKTEISITPSVFNFYLYLRNQPLIVRRHLAQTIKDKKVTMKDSKEALKETSEAITPFERRLYFITAHQHFLAGCPSLALEVLSRLPLKIAPEDHANFLTKERSIDTTSDTPEVIASGTINDPPEEQHTAANLFGSGGKTSSTLADTSDAFDWGAPVSDLGKVNANDFQIDITIDSGTDDDGEDGEDKGLEMKIQGSPTPETVDTTSETGGDGVENVKLDIMAQQLKFIACLKILMEELSTLATGFEVDGGRLRYHLYVWLEKSVMALKVVCNYRTFSMRGSEGGKPYGEHDSSPARASSMILEDMDLAQSELAREQHSTTEATGFGELKPTLHEVLLAENLDFEAKLHRAARRKEWLQGNEALLRTLLSYCSLHGAHGGGLASVRMELILLLQELQQERSQHQLLSPLPFPTTLPLLAASVACQKTVIADPIRHLHSVTNDILMELTEMKAPPLALPLSYCEVFVLRDLGLSLSACVYQSLSNSDNLDLKNINIKEDLLGASVVCANSHLMAGNNTSKKSSHTIGSSGTGNFTSSTATGSNDSTEPLNIITPPNKWPGVQSLRALLARDKDEDSPKLHTLLCESYVAIYLSQLVFALAACDSHVLYRLVGLEFNEQIWGYLFGGGAKKLIHVVAQTKATTPTPQNSKDETQSSSIDLFNALSQQRMKLHMKILQQLNQDKPTPPTTPNIIKEDRTTYKEQFVPPSMSIISYLMSKPKLSDDYILIDYDSSESVQSEDEDMESFDDLDDNIFGTSASGQISSHTLGLQEAAHNLKKQDLEQYAWSIMRFAVIKLARLHLAQFLQIAGVELRELPTTSPLIHTVFKILEMWTIYMKNYMESFEGPPSNFLPNNYVEANRQPGGPPIWKYKVLLETNNTPFRSHNAITKPMKRLWNYLVRQERVQDLFIRYIFATGKPGSEYADYGSNQGDGPSSDSGHHHPHGDPVRIVHKEQDNISAFCLNNTQSGYIAIATPKEVQELDISVLLEPVPWLEEEAEFDILNMLKVPESLSASNYLVVQHPADRLSSSPGGKALQSQPISVTNQPHPPKGTVLLKRHKTEGTRRLCSHPTLPYYLSGSQDGAVNLWEWKHQNPLASPRAPGTFAKVTKVAFNQIGNKFGVTDGDGNLSLWQVALCTSSSKPFFSMQVHSKHASDFTFLGSSSLIITAGQSTDHKNICMWDTLLPAKKSLVSSFSCHEHHGASVVLYAPLNQLLITGGKKGEVFIFDMRQRTQRNKFQAHDSAIKCMTLDPGEEFFVTGSADGDIKVWSLIPPQSIVNTYLGEHSRSTIFRNIGMGVSHLYVDNVGRLFSCGADGSLKMRQLPGHR